MDWLAFSYSLPSGGQSSPRVSLWRRLRRLGAVSLTGGVYLLPDTADCLEGFGWLAQEVEQAGGKALVMRVQRFEGLDDGDLVDTFHAARSDDYRALADELGALEREVGKKPTPEARLAALEALEKLRKKHGEVARIDYFGSPEGAALAAALARLGRRLVGESAPGEAVEAVDREAFRGRIWVTRPHPHVDRLASIWLIRRRIDPDAEIRYRTTVAEGEVGFDMQGARFGHSGNRCTFETLLAAFGFADPGLAAIAEIVHELDLRDGRYARPEAAGIDAVLEGWRRAELSDRELEARGEALFDGLYGAFAQGREVAGERLDEPR